jgi:hypothetical protein
MVRPDSIDYQEEQAAGGVFREQSDFFDNY